jgi:flavin reductase (DIM6/NTAB) family NADH-FMN oxidoreductase RutF
MMARADGIVGPVPEGADPDRYDRLRRRVLWSMPTGLFVVGSRAGGRVNLMTANWVMQVATAPKLVAVSVERDAETRRLIEEGGGFSVSILARADRALVRRFVKPVDAVTRDPSGAVTAMQDQPVLQVGDGLPYLAVAVGWLACSLRATCRWERSSSAPGAGDPSHVLFVGEVVDVGERAAADGPPEGEAPSVLRMEDTRMNYGG